MTVTVGVVLLVSLLLVSFSCFTVFGVSLLLVSAAFWRKTIQRFLKFGQCRRPSPQGVDQRLRVFVDSVGPMILLPDVFLDGKDGITDFTSGADLLSVHQFIILLGNLPQRQQDDGFDAETVQVLDESAERRSEKFRSLNNVLFEWADAEQHFCIDFVVFVRKVLEPIPSCEASFDTIGRHHKAREER